MRISVAAALAAWLLTGTAQAATDIDLFFPVPVQGKLANEMARLAEVFNKEHPDIHVTPVYTGSYLERRIDNQIDYTNYSRTAYGVYYTCSGGTTPLALPPERPSIIASLIAACGAWAHAKGGTHSDAASDFKTRRR